MSRPLAIANAGRADHNRAFRRPEIAGSQLPMTRPSTEHLPFQHSLLNPASTRSSNMQFWSPLQMPSCT